MASYKLKDLILIADRADTDAGIDDAFDTKTNKAKPGNSVGHLVVTAIAESFDPKAEAPAQLYAARQSILAIAKTTQRVDLELRRTTPPQ